MERVNHYRANKADCRSENPKEASQVRNVHGDSCQGRTCYHSNSSLRSRHQQSSGLAEAISGDDQRVEVGDSGVGNSVTKGREPDHVAFGVS